jgi:hypothetical protein
MPRIASAMRIRRSAFFRTRGRKLVLEQASDFIVERNLANSEAIHEKGAPMNSIPMRVGVSGTLTPVKAILYGTLASGVLDATDGVIFFFLTKHLNPIQVLQYIASGALGASSYQGGLATAGLGMLFHFLIAAVVAVIYVLASQKLRFLRDQWAVSGLIYGASVYLFMNLIVVPHTAIGPNPIPLAALINGLIGHAVFVGLPIAFFAKQVSE